MQDLNSIDSLLKKLGEESPAPENNIDWPAVKRLANQIAQEANFLIANADTKNTFGIGTGINNVLAPMSVLLNVLEYNKTANHIHDALATLRKERREES